MGTTTAPSAQDPVHGDEGPGVLGESDADTIAWFHSGVDQTAGDGGRSPFVVPPRVALGETDQCLGGRVGIGRVAQ